MTEATAVGARAWTALALLFVINFLNYIDRQVISGIQDLIQKEFGLSGFEIGLVGSSFVIVYMLAAPVTGLLADRWPRHWFISAGVAIWSLATAAAGIARSFWQLLASRAMVGIGEAGYATVSPGLLSDLFPRSMRGMVMSVFYMAIPVGSAIGIGLGGYLGEHYGWRTAFMAVGLPGLLAAAAALWLPDPPRGAMDAPGAETHAADHAVTAKDALKLLCIRSYVQNTLGMAAYTFAMQGLAFWFPRYLIENKGIAREPATLYFGLSAAAAGILGTIVGGWLGDFVQRRTERAYFLLSGIGLAAGVPCTVLAIVAKDPHVIWSMLFVAEFFLFLNTGPLNAALANVVPASMRASAFAMNIFFVHLLGDVVSPPLVGIVKDMAGLQGALLLAAAPIALSSAIYFHGMNDYPRDVEKASSPLAAPGAG